ncbi:MAG: IreB family regulatory phosphoprotein [Ruminococcaceae bacterium]|nr:IreB family regulatory phosphoprotein [Oscillospiraceae bacterium]
MYIPANNTIIVGANDTVAPKSPDEILKYVYNAMVEKNYDPILQLTWYLVTGEPTYITNNKNARVLISTVDRDVILNLLLNNYFNK